MKKVVIGYLFHREKEWISLFGPDELVFNACMKKCNALWTKMHKCYLLPCNKMEVDKVKADLRIQYIIDIEPLRLRLWSRKQKQVLSVDSLKTNTPCKADNDENARLRDWELRYQ